MGKSAKFTKRAHKKSASKSTVSISAPSHKQAAVEIAKKKVRLEAKTKVTKVTNDSNSNERVLGGADYVSIMMGGRRKAKEEAGKLPQGMDDIQMGSAA